MNPAIQRAYDDCLQMAASHYENFPVVSRFVPDALRGPIAAIYAFARTADDFADEGSEKPEIRRAHLAEWRRQLFQCTNERIAENSIFLALGDTIERHDIPVNLLDDLIKAFEMDTYLVRFPTFQDVLFYCKHSANPVGRLVLWLFQYREERLFELSDAFCTALQLANFWQDSVRDLRRNRIYYPLEDLKHFNISESQILHCQWASSMGELVARQVYRTQELFRRGRDLCDHVRGMMGFHLKLTWLGGFEITRKLERQGFNPFLKRPSISTFDKMKLVTHAVQW